MFNETAYSGFGAVDCAAIKADCQARFPVDPNDTLPTGRDLNWECMTAAGYVSQCMDSKSYSNPGATTYPIDILTNPQNPNSLIPDFSSIGLPGGFGSWAVIAAVGLFVVYAFGRR